VRFDPSGRVTIFTGTASHGQGNDTIFAQIVADEFGLNLDDVTVLHGDTSMVPYGSGTHGSRACVVGGHAVLAACKRIKEKATRIAAYFLKTDAKELEFREGRVQVKTRPGQTLSLEDIAREAYFMKALPPAFEPGLEATAIYEPTGMTSSFGVDAAVVEVDLDTGAVKITKFVSVDDCGKAVNPLIVDGQIHGGIAQGIGQALYEQVLYDQAGQPVTRTLLDYLTPTATEVPDLLLRRTVTPSLTALAAKGMGEAGNMASTAAVANAIADALAPFGVADLATPLSPHAIWAALRGGRSTRTP
jgi:carbon-monoxide dehydrogenase large subunit